MSTTHAGAQVPSHTKLATLECFRVLNARPAWRGDPGTDSAGGFFSCLGRCGRDVWRPSPPSDPTASRSEARLARTHARRGGTVEPVDRVSSWHTTTRTRAVTYVASPRRPLARYRGVQLGSFLGKISVATTAQRDGRCGTGMPGLGSFLALAQGGTRARSWCCRYDDGGRRAPARRLVSSSPFPSSQFQLSSLGQTPLIQFSMTQTYGTQFPLSAHLAEAATPPSAPACLLTLHGCASGRPS